MVFQVSLGIFEKKGSFVEVETAEECLVRMRKRLFSDCLENPWVF